MAISKIYKGTAELTNVLKIYKGSELIYEKQSGPSPYLTFKSTSPFTLNVNDSTKHWKGTLEYSTDTTTWSTWSGTTTLSSVANKLYLRGSNNTVITGSMSKYKWVLTGTNIDCVGNIENLLDYVTVTNGNHPPMIKNCYAYMFYGCTNLATAPELPALTLANDCYEYMFQSCTSLTTAPALPALTLTNYCYYFMFSGCTSLTTAPQLPALTMKESCYSYMFYGCTSFKVSTTKTGSYQYAWRIPTSGTGTFVPYYNVSTLTNTGGTFTSNPSLGTTYYVENAPV